MIEQNTEKVARCVAIDAQRATNEDFSATIERNGKATNSLKALAGAVLWRNRTRNNSATDTPKHAQQIGQKNSDFVAQSCAVVAHDLTETERAYLTGWLSHIGETDAESIAEFWHNIHHKEGARNYFLDRAMAEATPDYRRHCRECSHLNQPGYCTKLRFKPVDDIPRNCDKFKE